MSNVGSPPPDPPAVAAATDALLWPAVAFTALAVLLVVVPAWWLYFSRLPLRPRAAQQRAAPALDIVAMLALSGALIFVGAHWDAAKHVEAGTVPAGADFLWGPHLVMYGGFLLVLATAALAVFRLAVPAWRAGERDPRVWFRSAPALGVVTFAAVYALASIPGDALWHAIFGVDLTAWSPPHVMLAAAVAAVIMSAMCLLWATPGARRHPRAARAAAIVLIALALNLVAVIGTIEWEIPASETNLAAARPTWLYAVAGAVPAFVAVVIAARAVPGAWVATATAVTFFALRALASVGLTMGGYVPPHFPPVFILGAVCFDVVRRGSRGHAADAVAAASAFTVGYFALAWWVFGSRPEVPTLSAASFALALAGTFVFCLGSYHVAVAAGRVLAGEPRRARRRAGLETGGSDGNATPAHE